jgi:hypothetical protein
MAIMARRLKHDWFQRYLVNPAAFRPGTRMPTAWPQGHSTLRDVLEGNTHQQIEAIWKYLSDGDNARAPQGLNPQAIVLAAEKDAVIYRNFIQGAGPRAIGVAYPEHVNLAFDANEMRLALIWQNKFVDASKHWVGRGPGFQGPLGDQVLKLESRPSFARLSHPTAEWPNQSAKEQGYKFRGYNLTEDNRPAFLYDFDGISVEDFPTGIDSKPYLTLKRTIHLKKADDPTAAPEYFRAAVGTKIEGIAKRTYRVDDDYAIRVESDSTAILTKQKDKWELRIPIKWIAREATITQEITW